MKIQLNRAFRDMKGELDGFVYKRFEDQHIVSAKPRASSVPPSAAQIAHRLRWRDATEYAKAVFADPARKEVYAAYARARGRSSVFALTLRDYMRIPEIHDVGLAAYAGHVGNLITINATDDFEITALTVVIFEETSGNVIEQGPATHAGPVWEYRGQTEVPRDRNLMIRVIAQDRAGNNGQATHPWHA